jgi:hypothetical protein
MKKAVRNLIVARTQGAQAGHKPDKGVCFVQRAHGGHHGVGDAGSAMWRA